MHLATVQEAGIRDKLIYLPCEMIPVPGVK